MQCERGRSHAPSDAPPFRAEEIDRTAQRMTHVDVGSGERPPVFEQEGEIRSERGHQRTDKAHADAQREPDHRSAVSRAFIGRKHTTADVGDVSGRCNLPVIPFRMADGRPTRRRARASDARAPTQYPTRYTSYRAPLLPRGAARSSAPTAARSLLLTMHLSSRDDADLPPAA